MKVLFMTPDYKQVVSVERDYSEFDEDYFNIQDFLENGIKQDWLVYILEEDTGDLSYQGIVGNKRKQLDNYEQV
jgi:hypothetical protein